MILFSQPDSSVYSALPSTAALRCLLAVCLHVCISLSFHKDGIWERNSVMRGEQVRVRCSTFLQHMMDHVVFSSLKLLQREPPPRVPLYVETILITSIPHPTLPLPLSPFSPLCCHSHSWGIHAASFLPFLPLPLRKLVKQCLFAADRDDPRSRARKGPPPRSLLEGQVVHGEVVFLALFLQHERTGFSTATKEEAAGISWALPSSAESPDGAACE